MITNESGSIKTLHQESEKAQSLTANQPVIIFNNELLTGWDDGVSAIRYNCKVYTRCTPTHKKVISYRPKTETSKIVRKERIALRQNSMRTKSEICENETKTDFREIEKIYNAGYVCITPKLKNIMLLNNKAKIMKMNEAMKMGRSPTGCQGFIKVHSVSPYAKFFSPRNPHNRLHRKSANSQSSNRPREDKSHISRLYK